MKKILIFLLLLPAAGLFAQNIDNTKSSIDFTVTNLGLDVEGKFRRFSGTVNFDPNALEESTFEVKIVAKSVFTDNGMRDEHLQEEEFFDVANHPEITFTSESISQEDGQYLVKGTLSMKGTSKNISIPFSYNGTTFSGSFSLDRNDYNVGGSGFFDTIGDTVTIQITCQLTADE